MKQVVNTKSTSIVDVSEVSGHKHYGFENNLGQRGLIVRSYGQNKYCAKLAIYPACSYEVTAEYSLKNVISDLIYSKFPVMEFDTAKELFAWIMEKL